MPHCYVCGRPLPADRKRVRRRVKTGEWNRKSYSGGRIKATQTHYGLRMVCGGCAKFLDKTGTRDEWMRHLSPFFWLFVLWLASLVL